MQLTVIAGLASLLLSSSGPADVPRAIAAPNPGSPIAAATLEGELLRVLIEDHAAPRFGLTVDEAWYAYDGERTLTIKELEEGTYRLTYGDGILDVLVDPNDF